MWSYQKKQYRYVFSKLFQLALNQIVGTVRSFLYYLVSMDFCISNDNLPFNQGNPDELTMDWDASTKFLIFINENNQIDVKCKRCVQYIGPNLCNVPSCFIVEMSQVYLEVTLLCSELHTEGTGPIPQLRPHTVNGVISGSSKDPQAL